ncbi:MAG: hypothetical protein BSOLF_0893 [Candidatus Carbobacillus altaicus]|uniref:Uncharacterized protein n=1 Tax=Candidatus Carbonibacillus altaicus TaxID=2163959 RepID=A0A2R6Y4V6_9BACL|nr:MAG: hypothetical protein BSOLF_0893 [Candidatus Carbobacillus altaicus]
MRPFDLLLLMMLVVLLGSMFIFIRRLRDLTGKVIEIETALGRTASLIQSFERLEKLVDQLTQELSSTSKEIQTLIADKRITDESIPGQPMPGTVSSQLDTRLPSNLNVDMSGLDGWQKEAVLRWQRGETAFEIARALGRGTGEVTLLLELIQRDT